MYNSGTDNMIDLRDWLSVSDYSPTGLVWINRTHQSSVVIGSPAFTSISKNGYFQGKLKGKNYLAHRVVFLLSNRYLPEQVDHISGNRLDNRPENLRASSQMENQHNRVEIGASFDSRRKSYRSQIRVDGERICLGFYPTLEEANAAYLEAKSRLHPTSPDRCFVPLRYR